MIKKGLAYVDDSTSEEIAKQKGTPTQPGTNSPYRNRSVEENLKLFTDMKAGVYKDGEKVLRAKVDMSHPNMHMRDPIIYRIKHAHHHRTSDTWCIYPMYDYAHCLSDSIEGISHSICTLEFEVHRPLYDWILEQLPVPEPRPHQYEFARLSLSYTVMSKRKLLQLVQEGLVRGWDAAVFYHRALDDRPALTLLPSETTPVLQQDFPRVTHIGATTTKALGGFVLRGEAVFTAGRRFESRTPRPAIQRDSITALAGLFYPFCCQYAVDVQYFQTSFLRSAGEVFEPRSRSGLSIRVADVASLRRVKASVLAVASPDKRDFWINPMLTVRLTNSSFLSFGGHWFNGRLETQFGQFRNASRVEAGLLWKVR